MKIASGLAKHLCDGFWAEAANTATLLDNILLTTRISVHFDNFWEGNEEYCTDLSKKNW